MAVAALRRRDRGCPSISGATSLPRATAKKNPRLAPALKALAPSPWKRFARVQGASSATLTRDPSTSMRGLLGAITVNMAALKYVPHCYLMSCDNKKYQNAVHRLEILPMLLVCMVRPLEVRSAVRGRVASGPPRSWARLVALLGRAGHRSSAGT